MSRRPGLWPLLVCAVWLGPVPVLAGGSGKPIPATFHMDTHGKLHVRTVVLALEQALSETSDINFTPLPHLLEPVGPGFDRLEQANKLLARGQELMNNLEVQKAVEALQRAVKLQRDAFHLMAATDTGTQQHGKLNSALAIAYFLAGDEQKARSALQQALVVSPGLEFDKKRFPPQMKRMFDEVRFLVDELGAGEARIRVDPPRAAVRVNGNFVGYSPVTSRGLVAGPNLITASRPGFGTRTEVLDVAGAGKPASVEIQLQPLPGAPADLLTSAVVEARTRRPGAALAKLARRVGRRMLFIGSSASRDDLVTVTLYAYDAKRRRISSGAEATVSALDPTQECSDLVNSLIPFVTWQPAPRAAKTQRGWWDRWRGSPYFWPVVGAAAGVVVVGASVGLGIYLGTRGEDHRGRNVVILPACRY